MTESDELRDRHPCAFKVPLTQQLRHLDPSIGEAFLCCLIAVLLAVPGRCRSARAL